MTRYVDQGSTEQPSAASVEIPEAAVEAACDLTYGGQQLTSAHARMVLEFALPYLAPAKAEALRERVASVLLYEEGSEWAENTNRHYELADALFASGALAPAGDGGLRDASGDPKLSNPDGLREALEKLIEEFDEASRYDTGLAYARVATRLRDALAAHPAAPAVPQPVSEATPELTSRPVDREALAQANIGRGADGERPGRVVD